MGKPGRPSVPAIIKELSGTIRKDRAKGGIEFDQLIEVPKPEVWIDDKAKRYFKNICKLLIEKKLLNVANVQLVLLMAQEFSTYEEATREIKKSGLTQTIDTKVGSYEQVSPWVGIRNQAQKNYREIATLFGLDPLSCQKIGPTGKGDSDDFEKLTDKYKK